MLKLRSTTHRSSRTAVAAVLLALAATIPLVAQLGSLETQFWRSGSPGIDSPLQANSRLGSALAVGDFNCDGIDDLAIGSPDFDFLAATDSGALQVIYGSPGGLDSTDSEFFDQISPDLPDVPELGDRFAAALAAGDFDGNGCADLAIGTPLEDIGAGDEAIVDSGTVTILVGGPFGLGAGFVFDQDSDLGGEIAGVREAGDRFGAALVAADFDLDGLDDLAIGVPGENLVGLIDAGAVNVLFGSAFSVRGSRDVVYFRGGSGELPESPEEGEQLGFALAAGELTTFSGQELAIGCPFRDPAGDPADAGQVLVVSEVGDASPNISSILASSAAVPGEPELEARFGAALAAADFDGDGFGELAIGIPGQGDGAPEPLDHGAVVVVEIDTSNGILLTQSQLGPDQEEAFDQFGSAVTAGDFNADGRIDLAIGVPFENLGGLLNAGMAHIVYGTVSGFDLDDAQTWIQTLDPSEDDDQFGFALATGNFSGRAGADLAIGVPGEELGAAAAAGGVNVIYSLTLFRDGFESGDLSAWDLVVP